MSTFPFEISNPGIGFEGELTSGEADFVTALVGLSYSEGDILYHNGTELTNLGIGTNGQVLTVNSGATAPEWTNAGAGDVTAASNFGTDNVLIKSDGTSKGVQATGITVADTTDAMSGMQSITIDASGSLLFGAVTILSDSSGTTTLNNIDALDATTEATIEAAIDTLANLTSIQGSTFTLTGDFIRSGAHSLTLTTTGATNVTFPTTGTLLANVSEDSTPQLGGALDGQGNDLNNLGVIFLTEQAAAEVDVAGKGQIWVQTATPNLLMFTDDAGTDFTVANTAHTLNDFAETSLADPGADQLVFWDDSDTQFEFISTLTGLSITANTLAVDTASTTTSGIAELATVTETNTGTDTTRVVTPDGLSSAVKSIMLTASGGAPLTTAGCSEPTKVEAATNDINYYVLDFDATTEEHAFWSFVMPENWDAGTVNATFYWTNASGLTTEGVVWGIAGGSWGNDDAIDAALGTEVETTDTWLAQGDMHISPESSAITIANAAAGEWVNIVVARKTGNASDDLTGDARLIGVKLTYTIDQYSDEI